jgi:hypothetical protein
MEPGTWNLELGTWNLIIAPTAKIVGRVSPCIWEKN